MLPMLFCRQNGRIRSSIFREMMLYGGWLLATGATFTSALAEIRGYKPGSEQSKMTAEGGVSGQVSTAYMKPSAQTCP